MKTSIRSLLSLPLLAVWLLPAFVFIPSAHALSCVGFTVEEAYERYEAVIVGQVDAMEPAEGLRGYNRTEVTVLRSFKTIEDRQITALENSTWGAGFASSEVGGQYLMYLNKISDGWEQPLCSPGMLVEHVAEELKWLEDKEIPLIKLAMSGDEPVSDDSAHTEPVNDGKSGAVETGEPVIVGDERFSQVVASPLIGASTDLEQTPVDESGSRVILAVTVGAFTVLAGAAVWMCVALNRRNRRHTRGL